MDRVAVVVAGKDRSIGERIHETLKADEKVIQVISARDGITADDVCAKCLEMRPDVVVLVSPEASALMAGWLHLLGRALPGTPVLVLTSDFFGGCDPSID